MKTSLDRRSAIAGLAALPVLAFVPRARGAASSLRTHERIYVGRSSPLTRYGMFDSDVELAQAGRVVGTWSGSHADNECDPKELARYLRLFYPEVSLGPAIPMEYKYVDDSTGVVHEICIGSMTRGRAGGRTARALVVALRPLAPHAS